MSEKAAKIIITIIGCITVFFIGIAILMAIRSADKRYNVTVYFPQGYDKAIETYENVFKPERINHELKIVTNENKEIYIYNYIKVEINEIEKIRSR